MTLDTHGLVYTTYPCAVLHLAREQHARSGSSAAQVTEISSCSIHSTNMNSSFHLGIRMHLQQ
jgi:hypothetical protein